MYTRIKLSDCQFHSGIKVRMYPSNKQKQTIKLNSNISRFIYNEYVALGLESYDLKKYLEKEESSSTQGRLDEIKSFNSNPTNLHKIHNWLTLNKDIDPQTKYLALKAYKSAWNMWRKIPKSNPPTFKKRNSSQKYSTDSCEIIDYNHIKINKVGVIRISGLNMNKIKKDLYVGKTTITMDPDGKYYLSATIASNESFSINNRRTGGIVGLDMNLSNFLVDSNGVVIDNPKFGKKLRKKLSREQRSLSRKYESAKREGRKLSDSKNYQRQRIKVSMIHKTIVNQREDFQHKLSTNIVENQDFIFAENIKPSQLNKNRKLSRAIADAGWSSFLIMLEYKALREGKIFLKVDPRYTTQTCNECGHVMSGLEKIKLGVEKWTCTKCESNHDRDHNAAMNIMRKGLELIK